jgi:hypothetical protein
MLKILLEEAMTSGLMALRSMVQFGHSFGSLLDEHGEKDEDEQYSARRDERCANSTAAADAVVKWRHWYGHRNVLVAPTRFADGWAVPAAVSNAIGQSGCLMRASSGNRNFCGVCVAELIRRMAFISGETFFGRSPSTTPPEDSPAHDPTEKLPQKADRILDSAFHGNTSLKAINIPASVATIGDFAFIGATGLRTVFNSCTTPQEINATTFAGLNRANINVIIPPGTTQAYRAAGWSTFGLIEVAGIDISARVIGLAFNGTSFAYNAIELAGSNVWAGLALHVEVVKHSGSNVTAAPIRQVVIGQSGVGLYTPLDFHEDKST